MPVVKRPESLDARAAAERLLRAHGPALADAARAILARHRGARLAGLIVAPDARAAAELRALLQQYSNAPLPDGELVGLLPRECLDDRLRPLLRNGAATEPAGANDALHWLPVVVAMRDALRAGLVPCGPAEAAADAT
jgi:hypothetical protein